MGTPAVEQCGASRCRQMWGFPPSSDVASGVSRCKWGLPLSSDAASGAPRCRAMQQVGPLPVEQCSQWGLPMSNDMGPPAVEQCGACRCRGMQQVGPLAVEQCSQWGLPLSRDMARNRKSRSRIWAWLLNFQGENLPMTQAVSPVGLGHPKFDIPWVNPGNWVGPVWADPSSGSTHTGQHHCELFPPRSTAVYRT